MPIKMTHRRESWPLAEAFVIARGAKTVAEVIVVELEGPTGPSGRRAVGRGECVPYARYGESIESVSAALAAVAPKMHEVYPRGPAAISDHLPAGAARNAVDCALWDLAAKKKRASGPATNAEISNTGSPTSSASAPERRPLTTAFTLSLSSPDEMAAKAAMVPNYPLLKLKLGAPGDAARMQAVRQARPNARLIADANEGWPADELASLFAAAEAARIELIEQPLPVEADAVLADIARPVPICADESAHVSADLAGLKNRYDAVNIKLDKTGGLTEARRMLREASRLELEVMVGCMVSTSLAMAPAFEIAREAKWVDLDGPLLLARDRSPALQFEGALIHPPKPALWG